MLIKLLGACFAIAATGTVLVYGFGLQVQRPIEPLQAKQQPPLTTPKVAAVATAAPVHAPAVEEPTSVDVEPPKPIASELDDEVSTTLPNEMSSNRTDNNLRVSAVAAPEPAQTQVIPEVAKPATVQEVSLATSETAAEQVFIFWQPFRSRGSAQGFAQGLSARAEVPISVIREETDSGRQYRVVLPYDSEAQRVERLAKLELATRLEMGE